MDGASLARLCLARRSLMHAPVDAIKAFRFMSDEERAQQQLQGAAEDHPMLDPQLLAGPSSDKPNAKDGESPLGLLGPPLWSRNPVPLLYGSVRCPDCAHALTRVQIQA